LIVELSQLINFAENELYLLIAFICGLLLGYMVAKREDNM